MNLVKFDRMARNPAWDTINNSMPVLLVQEAAWKTFILETRRMVNSFRYPEQEELE